VVKLDLIFPRNFIFTCDVMFDDIFLELLLKSCNFKVDSLIVNFMEIVHPIYTKKDDDQDKKTTVYRYKHNEVTFIHSSE
jgi:hypothetical protein